MAQSFDLRYITTCYVLNFLRWSFRRLKQSKRLIGRNQVPSPVVLQLLSFSIRELDRQFPEPQIKTSAFQSQRSLEILNAPFLNLFSRVCKSLGPLPFQIRSHLCHGRVETRPGSLQCPMMPWALVIDQIQSIGIDLDQSALQLIGANQVPKRPRSDIQQRFKLR